MYPKIINIFDDIEYSSWKADINLAMACGMTEAEVDIMTEKFNEAAQEAKVNCDERVPDMVQILAPRLNPKELALCVSSMIRDSRTGKEEERGGMIKGMGMIQGNPDDYMDKKN
mgnify:CR=1 FL=1